MTQENRKRCDRCAHWNADEGKTYTHAEYGGVEQTTKLRLGACQRAIPFWNASEWSHNKDDDRTGRVLLPEFADRKFFAQDGSDYRAVVLTAPDFYCAEYSPIAPPEPLK